MKSKVIFISGPYRAFTYKEIEENIKHAKNAAIKIWQSGNYAICPHMNCAHFDNLCPDEVWLQGDLEILRRCDAVYMLRDHLSSEGSKAELALATELGLEIIYEPE